MHAFHSCAGGLPNPHGAGLTLGHKSHNFRNNQLSGHGRMFGQVTVLPSCLVGGQAIKKGGCRCVFNQGGWALGPGGPLALAAVRQGRGLAPEKINLGLAVGQGRRPAPEKILGPAVGQGRRPAPASAVARQQPIKIIHRVPGKSDTLCTL